MNKLLSAVLLIVPLVAGAQVVSTTPPVDEPPIPQPQGVPPPPSYAPPPSGAPVSPVPPDITSGGPSVTEPPASQYATPDEPEMAPPAVAVAPAPAPAGGQWVYTSQYGWVWMPYGSGYTYMPAGAYPDMYVYYPSYGWRWVVAPWVWGIGPRPYFGVYGYARYGWYGHGFGRWYGYRGGPVWASRGWNNPGWYGHPVVRPGVVVRPAPHYVGPRPGFVGPRPGAVMARPAPVVRSAPFAHAAPHPMGHVGGFGRR